MCKMYIKCWHEFTCYMYDNFHWTFQSALTQATQQVKRTSSWKFYSPPSPFPPRVVPTPQRCWTRLHSPRHQTRPLPPQTWTGAQGPQTTSHRPIQRLVTFSNPFSSLLVTLIPVLRPWIYTNHLNMGRVIGLNQRKLMVLNWKVFLLNQFQQTILSNFQQEEMGRLAVSSSLVAKQCQVFH